MTERIAILGGGVIGETLLRAVLATGHAPGDVVVSEKRAERAAELRDRFGVQVAGNRAAVDGAALVLIAVKPQDVPDLLEEVAGAIRAEATVLSLAAGVRTATIEAALGDGVAVVRAMPNTPALVGQGMFGVSPGASVPEDRLTAVVDLLGTAGTVQVLDEKHQDAVTAVSGSGPAYVFYLAEAMVAGGVSAGLDAATARTLAVQTIVGSAALLASSEDEPAELRRRVTSPHGTTAAAIAVFDERGVGEAIAAGVRAAASRSAELSGSSGDRQGA